MQRLLGLFKRGERPAPVAAAPKPIERYVVLGPTGLPDAFYTTDLHRSIPSDAIKITEAQYRAWHDGVPHRLRLVDGKLVEA